MPRKIPEGYHTATPYLMIQGASDAIEFYKRAFGAQELFRMPGPDGKIGHAEIQVGDSRIMMADAMPEMPGAQSARQLGGSPVALLLYVEDVDAATEKAVNAGAQLVRPVEDQFYGDRTSTVADPFGHQWFIHTHIEDVSPEEMEKRAAAARPA